jgi:hypothetical protein
MKLSVKQFLQCVPLTGATFALKFAAAETIRHISN